MLSKVILQHRNRTTMKNASDIIENHSQIPRLDL